MFGYDRSQRAAALAAGMAIIAACASNGGIRPRYGPEPQAVMLVLDLPAVAVTDEMETQLIHNGLTIHAISPREGYVESNWYDLDARKVVRPPFGRLDRVVKLRFFADPMAGNTRLFAECVVRAAWDPSVPERELERMPAAGHPGRVLLDSILTSLRASIVHDTVKAGGPPLRPESTRDTAKAGVPPGRP